MDLLVNIDVDDLQNAIGFYEAAFDLQVRRRIGALAVEMQGSSVSIYLLVKPAGSPAFPASSQSRSYERHWTPVHLDFVVSDIDSAVGKATAANARLEQPIATREWGRLALMTDPFGHGFCFVQFLGRGYDEIVSRRNE